MLAGQVTESKIMIDDDRPLKWICATDNSKLKKGRKKAGQL